jgi:RHS repeat-associated protein
MDLKNQQLGFYLLRFTERSHRSCGGQCPQNDRNDRLISETNAYGATRTYTYDAAGNRTGITARNGKTRRFTYDALNRLTNETWVGNGRSINSTYDAAGQLTRISDANAAYAYTYDPDGRLLSVNNAGTAGSPSVLMSYGYDAVGNVLSAADAINGTNRGNTTYNYDPLDRLTSMRQSGTDVSNKRVDYTYNAVGQATNIKRFSDLSGTQSVAETNHTFDRLNRLTNINHSRGGTPLAAYNYNYDPNSRITGMSNNDGTAAYSYDATDQLTGVDYSYQPDESFSYDANGNRTNPGYVTGKNNRLLSDGKFNYEYDDEGNVIRQTDILTGEVTAYTWDYRNRLTNVTRNGAPVGTYNYDTYDQRIGKTTATGTNRFVYGQNQNIALEFDGSGVLTNRYLHGNSIDAIMADEANGSVGWTLTDNLGTVRDVVDGTGARQNHFVYDSFGNVTSETNPSFDTRFTFTGREFDAETGNYDYRNRQLRPSSGRFIESDPMGFSAGDTNLYRYVFNSPTNLVDNSGNSAKEDLYSLITAYRLRHGLKLLPGAVGFIGERIYELASIVPEYAVDFLQYALDNAASSSWGTNPGGAGSAVKRVKIAPERIFSIDSPISKALADDETFKDIISRDLGRKLYPIAEKVRPKTSIDTSFGSSNDILVSEFFRDKLLNPGIAVTLGNFTIDTYNADVHIFRSCDSEADFSADVFGSIRDVYDFNRPTGTLSNPINYLTQLAYEAQLAGELAVYKVKVNFRVSAGGKIDFPGRPT